MVRPPRRHEKPLRLIDPVPSNEELAGLRRRIRYQGSPKHKLHPERFGMPTFTGNRGDALLCDHDADVTFKDIGRIPFWMSRGIKAGLIGEVQEQGLPRVIWAVADNGWIFEGRITNVTQGEFHGYPLQPGSPNARLVYDRFCTWVERHKKQVNKLALQKCRQQYGF